MPRLAELMHTESARLHAFADHVAESLRADFDYVTRDEPIYAIKHRVKSYSSLCAKLQKDYGNASPDCDKREDLRRLLHENIHSVDEVFRQVNDVVGVRVIWYFEESKQDAAIRFLKNFYLDAEEIRSRWFSFSLDPDNNRPLLRVIQAEEKSTSLKHELEQFKVLHTATRYSSIHLIGGLSTSDPLHREFAGLRCEMQFRTLFEEAWGELSHHLEYKGFRASRGDRTLSDAKQIILQIDNNLQSLHDKTKLFRRHRMHPKLQLAHHYPIDTKGKVGSVFISETERAYELRREGDFDESRDCLSNLLRELPRHAPQDELGKLERRLRCDIAVCHLHKHDLTKDPADLASAETEIGVAKALEANSFWANLRLAEVFRRRSKLEEAIAYVDKSISRIGSVTWCSTIGLESDVTCYKATILRERAFNEFQAAYPSPRTDEQARARGDHALSAARVVAEDAFRLATTKRSTREVVLRATSLLLHLRLWCECPPTETIELYRTLLETDQKSPGDLGRLALCLVLGKADVSNATEAIRQAESLCANADQLVASQAARGLQCNTDGMARLSNLISTASRRASFVASPFEWFKYYPRG